jgi:hypothetical protein
MTRGSPRLTRQRPRRIRMYRQVLSELEHRFALLATEHIYCRNHLTSILVKATRSSSETSNPAGANPRDYAILQVFL